MTWHGFPSVAKEELMDMAARTCQHRSRKVWAAGTGRVAQRNARTGLGGIAFGLLTAWQRRHCSPSGEFGASATTAEPRILPGAAFGSHNDKRILTVLVSSVCSMAFVALRRAPHVRYRVSLLWRFHHEVGDAISDHPLSPEKMTGFAYSYSII